MSMSESFLCTGGTAVLTCFIGNSSLGPWQRRCHSERGNCMQQAAAGAFASTRPAVLAPKYQGPSQPVSS